MTIQSGSESTVQNRSGIGERSRPGKSVKNAIGSKCKWNETRKDTSANDLRRVVDETGTINPDLRKELLYSWQYGFIEDKPQEAELSRSPNLLRKDENRKSGKALTNLLKGKRQSETPLTVKMAAGAVYRKSDIAQAKNDTGAQKGKSSKKGNESLSPHGDKPKTKSKKKANDKQPANSDSDAIPNSSENLRIPQRYSKIVILTSSRDTEVNGGLNLSVKRAIPNNAGPVVENSTSSVPKGAKQSGKKAKICSNSSRGRTL